ncbi:MAG TPA: S9 family peptidase [Candidatus Acidoferrales bacterium]|nr:S9 family peptidase [Candidatus Acidoferrales bacterium]
MQHERLSWVVSVALIWLLCAGPANAQTPSHKLSLDLYLEFEEVTDPQISPDGKQVVFTRRWVDKLNDKWESALWVMNADGSRQRFLRKGSSARWSPDGTRIAYLADGEPKGTQIFVYWMDAEGATTQLTHVEKPPANLCWSPDSRSLAFSMLVPKLAAWNIKLPPRPDGAKWTKDPRIVERLVYRADRMGFLDDGYRHIFLLPATGGTPRQLTSGDYNDVDTMGGSLCFTPEGREILFSGLRTDDWEYAWEESQIYAVNVQDKSVRQLTHRKGLNLNPVVSPDGKLVAYTGHDWTDDTYRDSRLYVMGLDGSNPRLFTPNLDRTPQGLHWAPDGSGIYFTAEDRGTRNLHFASLRGEVREITRGQHVLNVTAINRNGQAVGTLTSFEKPPDVVALDLNAPQPRQLTFVNDDILGDVKLGEVEEIWYNSVDGFRIQGWIVKPPDFDPQKKYPLMLSIHGGPHAMYNVGFSFSWQEHAANGYVVLYTNPRGSSGYGSTFGNAIKNAYPGKDFDDLMKGVDEVIARGYIDTRNLFVYGCSGGGVLTAWTVGHTDRFAAASSNCPVINWVSFAGATDINVWAYHRFDKLPWEDPMPFWQHSPLMYVGIVKTPTMLMTGELDMRTPISQTEEFYEALKVRKVPTAMVRFNEEYHGTSSKPSNFLRTQLYLRYWFEKYMRR